ncbi:MAG: peptidoglycan DD-metalloendopeptidase family protein [Rickettsiales bacterium]|nr:peptidoglycan DD-metalloendopeptidase family protein [Rickettsiales bacterium]
MLITDDNITSYTLPRKLQLSMMLLVGIVISWASFSSGKYFAYRKILVHKEEEIQQANMINLDLQTRIDSLQGNLVRLNSYFDTVKNFDYNKSELNKKFKRLDQTSSIQKKEKISQLEKKEQVLLDINNNTLSRIAEIEEIVAITKLPLSSIKPDVARGIGQKNIDSLFSNQGGPNTNKVFDVKYDEENIDKDVNFDENVSRLFFLENLMNSVPLSAPVGKYYISSYFGDRFDPFYKKEASHFGVDFAGPMDSEVKATSPGVIKFSGRKGNYGNLIEIDHGYKVTTRYGHLKSLNVVKGDIVERGQVIGVQGNTGRSSGPHLHYEIRYMNKPYNPINFLRAGRYVF